MRNLSILGIQKPLTFKRGNPFFLLDTFKGDAASIPAVRHCVPGPGYFKTVDTGNRLSIVNGKRRSSGNSGAFGNPLMYFPRLFNRDDTLMLMASHTSVDSINRRVRYDFHTTEGIDVNSNAHSWIFGHGVNSLVSSTRLPDVNVGILCGPVVPIVVGAEYRVGIILSPVGARTIIKFEGQEWEVWGSDNWSVWNPLYFNISSQTNGNSTRQDTDWVAVTRLSYLGLHSWDDSKPVEYENSSPVEGLTTAHPLGSFIEFYIDSPPVTGSMLLHFRKLDEDNYWELELSNDQHTWKINKKEAGVFSNVETSDILVDQAGFVSTETPLQENTPIVIELSEDWTAGVSASFKILTAASFVAAGDTFEIYDLAGGSIRDLIIRNKVISGDALAAIKYVEQRILENN